MRSPNTYSVGRVSLVAGQKTYRLFVELKDDLAFADHPELIPRNALDRGGIGAQEPNIAIEPFDFAA